METNQQAEKRKAFIKAITSGDSEAMRLLILEKQGKAITVSSIEQEEAYLMSIYKAVMSNDETEVERLPEAVFVNGYQSQYAQYFQTT